MANDTEDHALPVEDLMDSNIDDLEDLPSFETPPVGFYGLDFTLEKKKINEKPAIGANFVIKEVLELKNKDAKMPELGAKFGMLFMMDNEWGQKAFTSFIRPVAAAKGLTKMRDIITACAEATTINATVKHRFGKDAAGKKDLDNPFANVENVQVA